MISFTTVENAIRAWVISGTGFASNKVYFEGQEFVQVARPYATITITSIRKLGLDWGTIAEPTVELPNPPNILEGPRELSISISVYTNSQLGEQGCLAIGENLITALQLDSVHTALRNARVSVVSTGPVILVPGFEDEIRPVARANVDVVARVMSEKQEILQWADSATVTIDHEN